jgi:hypothetical protein
MRAWDEFGCDAGTGMSERACLNCAAPLTRRKRQSTADWEARVYCSLACFYDHKYPVPLGAIPNCQTCGETIQRPTDGRSRKRWFQQKYCSTRCLPRKQPVREPMSDERIDRVEQLLAAGEAPAQIAATLGIKMESLGRWLNRLGYDDLARPFYRGYTPKGQT